MADRWSEEEDDIIRNNWNKLTYMELQKLLPKRGNLCIRQRISKLGGERIPNNPWTPEEEEILKATYHIYTINEIIERFLPFRTSCAIKKRACYLGIIQTKSTF